jgi:hypothetical protein
LCRSNKIRFLVCGALVIAVTSCSRQQPPPTPEQTANKTAGLNAERVAKAYGLDSFGQVEAIRYTWNAQFPGTNNSRSWVWEPK